MVFDPSKTDAERMYDKVEDAFPAAWIELMEVHNQKQLKIEPPQSETAKEDAEEIQQFLDDKGLRTQINKLGSQIFEVTATTNAWKDC